MRDFRPSFRAPSPPIAAAAAARGAARLIVAACCLASAAACDRTTSDAPPVSTSAPVAGVDSAAVAAIGAPATGLTWSVGDAGPALFVAGGSAGTRDARVVFPELTDSTMTTGATFELDRVRGTSVDLFSRAGALGRATVGASTAGSPTSAAAAGECTEWPLVRLEPEPARPWTVALAAGRATAIALDSMESLARPDSARRAAEVARLASALPNDTAPAFRGIPFAVRSARRFTPVAGVEALIAEVTRKVGEEARPREEHILVIAERRDPGEKWQTVYSERTSDSEETVETRDVLAALLIGAARTPTLVLSREYGEGGTYGLLERDPATGRWRVRWGSAYEGC